MTKLRGIRGGNRSSFMNDTSNPSRFIIAAVSAFDRRVRLGGQRSVAREKAFRESRAWAIETVLDAPEIWVPATASSTETCIEGARYFNLLADCSRPRGHGGRHAHHGQTDQSGKWVRVWAVWP